MLHLIYIIANLVLPELWSGKNVLYEPKLGRKYGEIKVLVWEKHVQMKGESPAFEYLD